MSAQASADEDKTTLKNFEETFEFCTHERDDVRKMAVNGIASHSLNNSALNEYVVKNPEALGKLINLVNEKQLLVLGDALSALVNLAADSAVCETMISQGIVSRCMRMLDVLERGDVPQPKCDVYCEMTLMLLNNLTAAHVTAVQELLQLDDEDLKGFFVSKLKTFYDRREPNDDDEEEEEEARRKAEAEAEKTAALDDDETSKKAAIAVRAKKRSIRKWYLHICLNVTRLPDGQRLIAADDEWLPEIVQLLDAKDVIARVTAAQTLRNVANLQETHPALVDEKVHQITVRRLCDHGEPEPLQEHLLDVVTGLLTSERGNTALEDINARKHLTEANLPPKIEEKLKEQVLPYLDEVVDAVGLEGP